MFAIDRVDAIISESLQALASELARGRWKGRREREVVSLFCFGHLVGRCRAGTPLYDPAQISIEVPVPQVPGQQTRAGRSGQKAQVCKDIVIWPNPRMACWNERGEPAVAPSVVIEWKHNGGRVSEYDIDWLREFSSGRTSFVGYAVSTTVPSVDPFTLRCTRVFQGEHADRWIDIEVPSSPS
jgi:hypothetical protein